MAITIRSVRIQLTKELAKMESPGFSEVVRPLFQACLELVLIDRCVLRDQIRLCQNLRCDDFSSRGLTRKKLKEVATKGIDKNVLNNEELAALLINPLNLHEIFDQIQERMPQVWQLAMIAHGKRLRKKYKLGRIFPPPIALQEF